MLYAPFLAHFTPDRIGTIPPQNITLTDWLPDGLSSPQYEEFARTVFAPSFNNGLLRFLSPATTPSIKVWNSEEGWMSGWQAWKDRLWVFGYDWMGRQFGFDRASPQAREPEVNILDAGSGGLYETHLTFGQFINDECAEAQDEVLLTTLYQKWLHKLPRRRKPPQFDECIGLKVPLFLGGEEKVKNLERISLDVYLHITGQIYSQLN